jgi:hypothetical protein
LDLVDHLDAVGLHSCVEAVDVQDAWREVVDMCGSDAADVSRYGRDLLQFGVPRAVYWVRREGERICGQVNESVGVGGDKFSVRDRTVRQCEQFGGEQFPGVEEVLEACR